MKEFKRLYSLHNQTSVSASVSDEALVTVDKVKLHATEKDGIAVELVEPLLEKPLSQVIAHLCCNEAETCTGGSQRGGVENQLVLRDNHLLWSVAMINLSPRSPGILQACRDC